MAFLPLLQGPEDHCDFTSKTLKVIRNIAAQNVKVAFPVPSQKGPSIGISSQKYLHTKILLSGWFERELGTEYGGGLGIFLLYRHDIIRFLTILVLQIYLLQSRFVLNIY